VSSRDDFSLPYIDGLVDNSDDHALISFMDGYASYHQVKLAIKDMKKATFISPWKTYCFTMMSFGLKNAGRPPKNNYHFTT